MRSRLVRWLGRSLSPSPSASTLSQSNVHAASDSSGAAVSDRHVWCDGLIVFDENGNAVNSYRYGWEVDNGYGLVVIDQKPLAPSRRVIVMAVQNDPMFEVESVLVNGKTGEPVPVWGVKRP